MKKRSNIVKIFGIGAAVLLIVVALVPACTADPLETEDDAEEKEEEKKEEKPNDDDDDDDGKPDIIINVNGNNTNVTIIIINPPPDDDDDDDDDDKPGISVGYGPVSVSIPWKWITWLARTWGEAQANEHRIW